MKFEKKGLATAAIAAIVVVVIVVVGAGAYIATSSGAKTSTATVVSTATQTNTVTSTSTSLSVSTATATSTATSTSVLTSTSVSTTTATSATTLVSTSTKTTSSAPEPAATLTGAGSTFVYPLMSEWTFAYTQEQPNIEVNYASVGSGAGITQITAQTVNFGASDAPLTAAQYAALPSGTTLVTIPDTISAVVPAYNLPGISNGLKFTGNVLAEIFLGKITMWNDPAIAALNPGVTLPNQAIVVIHRSDGSGTMYAFTQYLSDSNAQWKSQVGFATSVNWPTGLGCKGNEGVAGCIENNQYSLGPLELSYVVENPTLLSYGSVQNAAGTYVLANVTNIAAAATAGATTLPAGNAQWSSVSIINSIYNDTAAANIYPITTFSYLMVYQQQTNQQLGVDLVNFLYWVVNNAQQAGTTIGYVPLPANVIAVDNTTIESITYNGTPLYAG